MKSPNRISVVVGYWDLALTALLSRPMHMTYSMAFCYTLQYIRMPASLRYLQRIVLVVDQAHQKALRDPFVEEFEQDLSQHTMTIALGAELTHYANCVVCSCNVLSS